MDPQTGRFVSEDPFGGDPNGPVSLHRYLYANQSPLMLIDPTGEMSIGQMQMALVSIGILSRMAVPRFASVVNRVNPTSLMQGIRNTHVYIGVRDGMPVYVGIAKDVGLRAAQHGARFRLERLTSQPLFRRQARAVEQLIIERNPHFENKINSIAKSRDWYDDAKRWAELWFYNNKADWPL